MNAQLALSIDSVNVTNFKISLNDSVIDESDGDGPNVLFYCKITNTDDSSIIIYPRKAVFYIKYFCYDEEYVSEIIPIVFKENDSIKVNSKSSICFDANSYILLGTKFRENTTGDYRNILLKILPTISIHYYGPAFSLNSCRIEKVILN